MTATSQSDRPATGAEIQEILGPIDNDLVSAILSLAATPQEISEAKAWLSSDDYLHRQLHHALQGKAAEVFALIASDLEEEPER